MGNKKKIQGTCPYCGAKDNFKLCDCYYAGSNKPYATNVTVCFNCENDEIEIRKINNRRYKVVGKW